MVKPAARRLCRVFAGARRPAVRVRVCLPEDRPPRRRPAGARHRAQPAEHRPPPARGHEYNHNFLVLDRATTGPEFTISFPFRIQATRPPDPKLAEIRANQIVYLEDAGGRGTVTFGIEGFGKDERTMTSGSKARRTGAGFRVTSDRAPGQYRLLVNPQRHFRGAVRRRQHRAGQDDGMEVCLHLFHETQVKPPAKSKVRALMVARLMQTSYECGAEAACSSRNAAHASSNRSAPR